MSETVHYIGKLIPTGKTLKQLDPKADDIWDLEYQAFVEIGGLIFTVEKDDIGDDDIFEAKQNNDGTISFQVKYYNGGCGFNEAIDEALGNIK